MEREVIFRDYQKATTSDFNNLQDFTRQSFDDLVGDAVTASLRYAGFNTVKSNVAEITVAPGRFYGANQLNKVGAVYTLPTSTIISLVQYLAVSSVTQRILTLAVYGVVNDADIQTRDYLTNTQTLQTQPRAVPMTSSRDAVLAIVAGAESAAPQPPVLGINQVAIASILVNNTGVVSVTMLPAALVSSTEGLDLRLDVVEDFDAAIGPRVSALASDLADLANRLNAMNPATALLIELMQDVALVKDKVGLPATYAQYGASFFLWADNTAFDTNNSLSLGYAALIENGCRFPSQNASLAVLALFNPIDPNSKYDAGSGLLLPAYTEVLKLKTGAFATSVAIGQYGYQTFTHKQLNIPYYRIRFGGTYAVCSNGVAGWWAQSSGTPAWWLPNFQTYQVQSAYNYDFYHGVSYTDYLWVDSWTEPYWVLDAVDHVINGALIAQSFLVSSDTWITKVGIYLASVASTTDVLIGLVQCTNGQPDLTKTIARGTMPGLQLHVGMNYVQITPAFAAKGSRLAVTVASVANHGLGLAVAGSYLDGTFFYSLDGAYYLGDFSKEMVLEVWGAKFNSAQTTIEFNAQNLQGGIRAIDLTARMIIPASCQLTFECLPDGTAVWLPVTMDKRNPTPPFADAPVLMRFRGRFIGTQDIMPGIIITDSIMKLWAPGPTFTLVTEVETLQAASTNVSVRLRVEKFNPVAHSLSAGTGDGAGLIRLYYSSTQHTVSSAVTVTSVDPSRGAYDIQATFAAIPSTASFIIEVHGTTNSITSVFHIAQLVWWAL